MLQSSIIDVVTGLVPPSCTLCALGGGSGLRESGRSRGEMQSVASLWSWCHILLDFGVSEGDLKCSFWLNVDLTIKDTHRITKSRAGTPLKSPTQL